VIQSLVFRNNTKFVVWHNPTIKYALDVLDYTVHPEYLQGVTEASLALLELDNLGVVGFSDVGSKILYFTSDPPLCNRTPSALTGRQSSSSMYHHHHQPINVPTAGAQTFLMDYT
jgi:hypothetical protein